MTYLESLLARRSAVMDELAALPLKPDYSAGGRSYQWAGLRKQLNDELKQLNQHIAAADPFYLESQGEP